MAGRLAPLTSGPIPKKIDHRKSEKRINNPLHLQFIRRLPCIITGMTAETVAHHITVGRYRMGRKEDDSLTVPLSDSLHNIHPESLHMIGEENFWNRYAIDPFPLARDLYALFKKHGHAIAAGHEIIRMHRDCGQIRKRIGFEVFDRQDG